MAEKVPPALRPGDTDDVLEGERLIRISRWGVVMSLIFAVFIFVYWLAEPARQKAKAEQFEEEGVARGGYYYALAVDPETGRPPPNAVGRATGQPVECARCHGVDAEGGTNEYLDPNTGQKRTVQVPDLATVFARYEKPPPGYKDAETFIFETIERGRPGTDMPTWGNEFGGPLTQEQIKEIVMYIQDIQKPVEVAEGADGAQIFVQFCAPCHGQSGAGGSGPAMKGGSEQAQFPNIEDHIAFVKEGSKPGTPYGTSGQGTGAMPGWAGTLNDEQIRLVVEYERSL